MTWLFGLVVAAALCGIVWALVTGADRVIHSVEALLAWLGESVKQSLSDYSDLESVDDEHTLVLRDGSLVSMISMDGSYRLVGKDEFEEADGCISRSLRSYLSSGGYALQVVYSRDPDHALKDIRNALAPSVATAQRLGLDLDDLFQEDVSHLARFCSTEKVLIALITRPSAVTKAEQKRDMKARQELIDAHPMPRLSDAPNLLAALASLRSRHTSYVSAVLADFRSVRLRARLLGVHEAVFEQRMAIDPEWTDESWRPILPGDKVPMRDIKRDPKDLSGAFWPTIPSQLFPRDAHILDLKTVEIGDRAYAPLHLHLAPLEIKPFAALFMRVSESRMPWRMSFLVESGGLSSLAFDGFLAALFGWSNSDNKLVKNSISALREAVQEQGEVATRFRVDFATWAPKGERKLLATRSAQLARAIEGWGGQADVREVSGDPVQGVVSSAPAVSMSSCATAACAKLGDVTRMLPLYRPASPWAEGAVLFRTTDGKLWPYQPNSPEQSSWINLIYAEPRSGKSVLGNQINLALCLSPGIPRLPLISIIDVGRSSSGLISLLQNALPEGQRHLVASIRLRMTPEFAINPFDTQLGNRSPLPHETAFLVNFISLLVTPMGDSSPADGMVGLVRMSIEEAYREYGDGKNPKRYNENIDPEVDDAVSQHGLHVDERTTWWEVVDELFRRGAVHAAALAQRYAVPVIADIAAISRAPSFADVYGSKQTRDGEPLLSAFARMLSEALRSYPILGHPTRFDLGDARVISMDLDEVARQGSAAADHQTAVSYMLARYVTARDFYLHEDTLPFFREEYRSHHERRIRDIRQDRKHLQYDEFHRTKRVAPVRDQVIGDMREGGKCGVMVSLISQSVSDFDDTMLEFATAKIVLSKANEKVARTMRETFGMSETAEFAIKNSIRPPGPHGATFLGMFATKQGDATHLLNNTMGGIKLWAFSTSNEDTYVRDSLYRRIPPAAARKFLARLYPGGSVVEEIERRKRSLEGEGLAGASGGEGVIDDFVSELLQRFERESVVDEPS